jgi:hypothetical protein
VKGYLIIFLVLTLTACTDETTRFENTTTPQREVTAPSTLSSPLLSPLPTSTSAPTPPATASVGYCPQIKRPALLFPGDEYGTEKGHLLLFDFTSQAECQVPFYPALTYRYDLVSAAGHIYYPVFDPATQATVIWHFDTGGTSRPLPFTRLNKQSPVDQLFVPSSDGRLIAWAQNETNYEVNPPLTSSNLWVAQIDGSNQRPLLTKYQNSAERGLELIRFSPDNQTLYFALQPLSSGGGRYAFTGRYDNLYHIPVTGGQPELVFACPKDELDCIGDIAPDGQAFVYTQTNDLLPDGSLNGGVIQVQSLDGALINTLTPPGVNYVGYPFFGPAGDLAFFSAKLVDSGKGFLLTRPGYISLVAPPYTGQPQTIFSDDSVGLLEGWLDEQHLIYEIYDNEASYLRSAIVTTSGQTSLLPPKERLGLLR